MRAVAAAAATAAIAAASTAATAAAAVAAAAPEHLVGCGWTLLLLLKPDSVVVAAAATPAASNHPAVACSTRHAVATTPSTTQATGSAAQGGSTWPRTSLLLLLLLLLTRGATATARPCCCCSTYCPHASAHSCSNRRCCLSAIVRRWDLQTLPGGASTRAAVTAVGAVLAVVVVGAVWNSESWVWVQVLCVVVLGLILFLPVHRLGEVCWATRLPTTTATTTAGAGSCGVEGGSKRKGNRR